MGFKQQFNIRMCPRIGQLCPHSWPFQIGSREHVEDMSISIQNLDLDGKQKHHCHSFPHKLIQWLSPATDSENGEAGRTLQEQVALWGRSVESLCYDLLFHPSEVVTSDETNDWPMVFLFCSGTHYICTHLENTTNTGTAFKFSKPVDPSC